MDSEVLSNCLTVVIPTYGRSDKILNSINSCNNPNVFIIVIDDNGYNTKNQVETEKLINDLIPKFNGRLSYFALEKNSGACLARNKGIELAKTSTVTFLDDDDILLVDETLEKLKFFDSQSDYDICCSDMYSKFNGRVYKMPFCYFRGLNPQELLDDGNCYTPMIMARKDSLVSIGGFDNCKKYQDHVLMLKVHLNNLKVCFFDMPTFIHVDHDEYRISNKACSYQTVKLRFKYEYELLNKINLDDDVFYDLKNVISNRKRYLCFYFIVMPRLDTFFKRYIGTHRFLMSDESGKNKVYIALKSLLYALKTINGFPFIIKRSAYIIKGENK